MNSENISDSEQKPKTYKNLLTKLPHDGQMLHEVYASIVKILDDANNYLKTWLSFQSLWDLQTDNFFNRLGGNLHVWMSCLNEIK